MVSGKLRPTLLCTKWVEFLHILNDINKDKLIFFFFKIVSHNFKPSPILWIVEVSHLWLASCLCPVICEATNPSLAIVAGGYPSIHLGLIMSRFSETFRSPLPASVIIPASHFLVTERSSRLFDISSSSGLNWLASPLKYLSWDSSSSVLFLFHGSFFSLSPSWKLSCYFASIFSFRPCHSRRRGGCKDQDRWMGGFEWGAWGGSLSGLCRSCASARLAIHFRENFWHRMI